MILGYEEPVQMPTMDIYSTDLMKMYIEGVKEQYKEGLEEYKDFMKQYQDFYSSLPGANEYWYNNTIKPAQDLIAQAAAQGVDLFKSPEGRAAIRNMINGVPLGKLQQIRKMSDVYDQYQKNKADLQKQGKYNAAREQWELQRMGLNDYTLLDENGNLRPWDRYSPQEDHSMLDLISSEFQKFAPQEDLGPSSRPFYRRYGVKPENQQAAIGASLKKMQDSGDYEFYKDQARQRIISAADASGQNLSPEEIDQLADMQLIQDIRDNAAQFLQEKEVYDQGAADQWKVRENARQQAANRANDVYIARLKNQQPDSGPLGFVDMLRENTKTRIYNKTGADPSNIVSALTEFRQRYKNLGYKDTDPQIARIDAILNTKDQTKLINNAKEYLIKGGYAETDNNGSIVGLSDKYYRTFNQAIRYNHNLTYNDMVSVPVSDVQKQVLLGMFASKTSDESNKNQYVSNNFQSSKYYTLTNRQAQIDNKPKNKIAQAFENYVNTHSKLKSYLNGADDILTYGAISSGAIDVNTYNTFKITDIDQFLTKSGYTKEQLANATGGHFINKYGKTIYVEKDKPNRLQPVEAEYIVIPSSTMVNVDGQNQAFIDGMYDKLFGGASNAFKIEPTRQDNSN